MHLCLHFFTFSLSLSRVSNDEVWCFISIIAHDEKFFFLLSSLSRAARDVDAEWKVQKKTRHKKLPPTYHPLISQVNLKQNEQLDVPWATRYTWT